MLWRAAGSSPLTRGKHSDCDGLAVRRRLIPAHAGKTAVSSGVCVVRPAHPRSRGENQGHLQVLRKAPGSSPLTRGKRLGVAGLTIPHRLIPAHAGKTSWRSGAPPSTAAHPRSRGENSEGDSAAGLPAGSSPLTRGKRFLTCAFIAQIDQILESLELCASSGSYSLRDAYATDVLQDQVRSIGLVPLSSRGAS